MIYPIIIPCRRWTEVTLRRRKTWEPRRSSVCQSHYTTFHAGVMSGVMMVFMPTISTFAIAELLTMNNIKLFGTTIQENINNSMWNYGAALSLIMLLLIAATSVFNTDDKDNSNEGGGLW